MPTTSVAGPSHATRIRAGGRGTSGGARCCTSSTRRTSPASCREVGYDDATTARVQDLVRKRGLGTDPEVQTLEDALCLVFVQTQLRDLAARLDPETLPGVVEKTKKKMSDQAIALALELELTPDERALLAGGDGL